MNTFRTLAPAVLLASALFTPVQGSIYVTNPVQSTVCHGGQDCPVQFVDNGESPLLSAIGSCDVGLYTGEYVLVQDLGSVDVSTTTSFSFTPNPAAGPNGPYYLVFSNSAIGYTGFSGSFSLDGMTGTTPGGSPYSSGTTSSTTTGTETTTTVTETGTTTTTITGPVTDTTTTTVPPSSTLTGPSTTGSTTTTSHTSTTTSHTTTTSASSTPTNAAARDGSSGSLAMALFLACAGALAF